VAGICAPAEAPAPTLPPRDIESTAAQQEQLAINRQAREDAASAARIKGITEIGKLGYQFAGTDLGKDVISSGKDFLGLGSKATPAVDSISLGGNVGAGASAGAQMPATQAVTNLGTGTGSQLLSQGVPSTDAAALSGSAPSVSTQAPSLFSQAASFAAPFAAGYGVSEFARGKTMESKGTQDFIEDATFGIAHAKKDAARISGAASGAAAGFAVAGPPGAIIGGIVGGIGKEGADFFIDSSIKGGKEIASFGKSVFDKTTDVFGTWICSETRKVIGMTDDEWKIIADFRHYARDVHSDWLEWYIDIGTELVKTIDGDEGFYTVLKERMLDPVMLLTEYGYPERAYDIYKQEVINLVKTFKPELGVSAPEEI